MTANIADYFAYELTHVPMSLFTHGFMRKADKPALAKYITTGIEFPLIPAVIQFVVDGGCLLHRVKWNASTTYLQIVQQYLMYTLRKFGPHTIVVFDGYDHTQLSIKDHEHQRRAVKCSTVVLWCLMCTSMIRHWLPFNNDLSYQMRVIRIGQSPARHLS